MKTFKADRKQYVMNTLLAKIEDLKSKRKTARSKKVVSTNSKAPRSMAEARLRPDFKEWAKAHDAEIYRHDTELRTWVYEEARPSDKPVPFTMTYKAKTNQFGGIERYKARCAIRGDLMKPGQQFDMTRTASHMPSQAARRLFLAAAVSEGHVIQS